MLFPTWTEAVEAAKKGEIVAAYRDAIEVRMIMKAEPSLALTMRTVSFRDLHSVLCIMAGEQNRFCRISGVCSKEVASPAR